MNKEFASLYPKYKLLTSFAIRTHYDACGSETIKFESGTMVNVICKAFDNANNNGSCYVVYSVDNQESTVVHEKYLEGFNKSKDLDKFVNELSNVWGSLTDDAKQILSKIIAT